MPIAFSASPLKERFTETDSAPSVWPASAGIVFGFKLKPLYPTVPMAALQDAWLYELPVIVDALRLHQARLRRGAGKPLSLQLRQLASTWQAFKGDRQEIPSRSMT